MRATLSWDSEGRGEFRTAKVSRVFCSMFCRRGLPPTLPFKRREAGIEGYAHGGPSSQDDAGGG